MNLTDQQIREIAEFATFRKFLLDNPTGIISLVSDTFDLFKVVTEYLPKLKDIILAPDGNYYFRGDKAVELILSQGHGRAWEFEPENK
jgi:nicotinamide phosphoribosyltransferase